MSGCVTLAEAWEAATRRLAAAGVSSPRLDARLLIQQALRIDAARMLASPCDPLGEPERTRLAELVERRTRREPISHILGEKEFWSLPFRVTADTLAPRPDTETLIEAALDRINDRRGPVSVLDLGTGSGCLLLTLLSERRDAWGLGVDLSAEAIEVARGNACRLGLKTRAAFVVGDWAGAIEGCFDIVLSNPPYIAGGELRALPPEVSAFEPRLALDGGADGLQAYRILARQLPRLLSRHGAAFLEVGDGQADPVAGLMEAGGDLSVVAVRQDLSGVSRCLAVTRDDGPRNPKKRLD